MYMALHSSPPHKCLQLTGNRAEAQLMSWLARYSQAHKGPFGMQSHYVGPGQSTTMGDVNPDSITVLIMGYD